MNLYLIGYRGSGKSTVAPLIAKLLGWSSSDTDEQVELLAGQPIGQIFEELGEEQFREWESTVLFALSRQTHTVISTGGGCPLANANRQTMTQTGRVVWLRADPGVLWTRIKSDNNSGTRRPQLTDVGGLQEVKQVLDSRVQIYDECADYSVDVESLSPEQVAEQIANWWDPVDN